MHIGFELPARCVFHTHVYPISAYGGHYLVFRRMCVASKDFAGMCCWHMPLCAQHFGHALFGVVHLGVCTSVTSKGC